MIGLAAALTRPNAEPVDVLPTLLGALAGAFALSRLVRAAQRRAVPGGRPPAAGERATEAIPAAGPPADEADAAGTSRPGGSRSSRGPRTGREQRAGRGPELGRGAEPDEGSAPDDTAGPPPAERDPLDWVPGQPSPPPGRPTGTDPGRRSFLKVSAFALAAGGIGALAGRSLSERSSVSMARSPVRFPRPAHAAPPLPPGTHPTSRG